MRRTLVVSLGLVVLAGGLRSDETPRPDARPMWQRLLTGNDAKEAALLQRGIDACVAADAYPDAIRLSGELLALRTRVQGADHWEAANAKWSLAALRAVAALPASERVAWRKSMVAQATATELEAHDGRPDAQKLREEGLQRMKRVLGERHPDTATCYGNLAYNLHGQGKYDEAEPLHRKALELDRELLGERHPGTATSYGNLAYTLDARGKHAEAEPLHRKAVELRRDLLGDRNPDIARSDSNLAANLNAQWKYAEAQTLLQKALDLRRELLTEQDPRTAASYTNLAANLDAQGKYAEAQTLLQKALDLYRELLTDWNALTALGYSNLAANLDAQGRYAEATPLHRKAIVIRRKLAIDQDRDAATAYNNLAYNLHAQGKFAEAEPRYRTALDIRRERLTDRHADTVTAYNNLAFNLQAQGKYDKARTLLTKTLDLCRTLHGERHLDTATGYALLAADLHARGEYAGAEPVYRKVFGLYRDLLGERHPDTAASGGNLAFNLHAQGKYGEASETFLRAGRAYEAARLSLATAGSDRAGYAEKSPYGALAATAVRLGRPDDAAGHLESDLARGLLDEMAAGRNAGLSPNEGQRHRDYAARLATLGPQILSLVTKSAPSGDERKELVRLLAERADAEAKLSELAVTLSRREVAPAGAIRAALPADSAWVAWADAVDRSGRVQEHWACVVRPAGPAAWERLPGSGPDRQWTKDDAELPRRFREALASAAPAAEIEALAKKVYAQRLAPVEGHLAGVKHLYVVPVDAMAGVPIEVLTDKYTVSYTPSGTLLAKFKGKGRRGGTDAVLALGDPNFRAAAATSPKPARLPPGGLLIAQVVPGGSAASAGLRAGDVLLSYAGTDLTGVEQLGQLIAARLKDKSVPVKVWRETEENPAVRDFPPGKFGIVLDPQPAPQAVAEKRKTDAILAKVRDGDWPELPGTRVELDRLTRLFGKDQVTALAGSDASEQTLHDLRTGGKLKGYSYLHFATHGEANDVKAFESSLILAQDKLPDTGRRKEGEPFIDGKLSAREVLDGWTLDAELVTLSACESGLGRSGGGDGLLGFAQAFLKAGARSVCLSLWKVDDSATALLMDRFYANMLTRKLRKGEALAEAKTWLRGLSADDAAKQLAGLTSGVARGKGAEPLKLVAPAADPATPGAKPFAHPRYWAGFILIGDPT